MSVRSIRDLERGRVRRPRASTVELLVRALRLTDTERDRLLAATSTAGAYRVLVLPPALELVGRDEMLVAISDHLARSSQGSPVVVTGRSGVGKTALAVALAHRADVDLFRDGVVWLPLRGMSDPLPSDAALRCILLAWGVTAPAGASTAELAAIARFHGAHRQTLLVLDDAASERHVRPLLVCGPASRVLITSRRQLSGLESAKQFVLHNLSRRDSIELLRRTGASATSEAAYEIVADACDGLPLALRIAASKLGARNHWSVEDLAAKLTLQRRLDVLAAGDRDVRSTIALSVNGLTPSGRNALLCMASCGTPVIPDWLGARVAGMTRGEFSRAAEELLEASLIDTLGFAGGMTERLRLRDLMREYAAEAAQATAFAGSGTTCEQDALLRATKALFEVMGAADARADELGFLPAGPLWRSSRQALGIQPRTVGEDDSLEEAYSLALVVIRRGCDAGLAAEMWPLALALASLQDRMGLRCDWQQTSVLIVHAVTAATSDPRALATVVASAAAEQLARGAADDAMRAFERAAALAAELGRRDAELWARAGEATALHYAGRSADVRPMLEEIVATARTEGAQDALWHASLTLARHLLAKGGAADALRCVHDAEASATTEPPPLWRGSFRLEAGRCHIELDDLDAADNALNDALRLFREAESPVWEAAAFRHLGQLQERRAEYAAALRTDATA